MRGICMSVTTMQSNTPSRISGIHHHALYCDSLFESTPEVSAVTSQAS